MKTMKERFSLRVSTSCYSLWLSLFIKRKTERRFKMKRKNETLIDFCFIRNRDGGFKKKIESLLQTLFKDRHLYWYLEEKQEAGADIVVAELRGITTWGSEEEVVHFLEKQGTSEFWEYLQGYQIQVFSEKKGCGSCGSRQYTSA
jgi:hypothetical protein